MVDVLCADAHVLAGERVAHGGEAHERRADHPRHARLAGPGRDGPREVAGIGGGGVHLPVGGNHDRASHARIMPERRGAPPADRPLALPPPGPGHDGRATP